MIERGVSALAKREHYRMSLNEKQPRTVVDAVRLPRKTRLLTEAQAEEFIYLRQLQNEILHGQSDYRNALTPSIIARTQELAKLLSGIWLRYSERNALKDNHEN